MRVYCPVCHKRYGQTKLEKDQSVDFQCECGTYLWLDQINGRDRIKWVEEKDIVSPQEQKVELTSLDRVPLESVSCKSCEKQVGAKLDLDILRQSLTDSENKLLDLMAEDFNFEQIAQLTHRSIQAVSQQFKNIQRKAK